MVSRWAAYKEEALALRRNGVSLKMVEKQLGVPRSTLSGWFQRVELTPDQRAALARNSDEGRKRGRAEAVRTHNKMKQLRIAAAQLSAQETLDKLELSDELLELAFAMLYWGEGAKANLTSMASYDPKILRFMLYVLKHNYGVTNEMLRCNLHLRMDQDETELKAYWAKELNLPLVCSRYTAFDKRSAGKPTYDHYKGVCVVACGSIAIQRKLIFLYTLFCTKVASLSMDP